MSEKKTVRLRRAMRTRERIKRMGAEQGVVRLCIHRTPRHIYAQLISPQGGKVLAMASSLELRSEASSESGKVGVAQRVGSLLAKRAGDAGVQKVACDRAGFQYHGRIAALVDAARENGLQV